MTTIMTSTTSLIRRTAATTGFKHMPALRFPRVLPAILITTLSAAGLSACGGGAEHSAAAADSTPAREAGTVLAIADTVVSTSIEASGVAEPVQQATLSTKLMGTVTAVRVKEGDVVRQGQVLLQIDARDVTAKASQVAASIADAEAMQAEASTQAARIRALYADSAATRAQYDAAQTGLARADAGVRAARAAASEVSAMGSYATVRAPFNGIVTARFADPGTFAAPGAPLLTVQDASTLRISVSAAGDAIRTLRRGQSINGRIEGEDVTATIEGIVPTSSGNLFTINATLPNRGNTRRAGSTASLLLPTGTQHALLVPQRAIIRDGDLTGVVVRGAQRDERRWVRLGVTRGSMIEVTSGLRAGESIVVPTAAPDVPASSTVAAPGA